jgi:transposase InsO family protein
VQQAHDLSQRRAAASRTTWVRCAAQRKWSMDFVAQRLADGRWIQASTVVDQHTRECLGLDADTTLRAIPNHLGDTDLPGPSIRNEFTAWIPDQTRSRTSLT